MTTDLHQAGQETEPVQFEVDLHNLTSKEIAVILKIKQAAEGVLFRWKTFPLVLPPSLIEEGDREESFLDFNNLFRAPTFDELGEIALGKNGSSMKLSDAQLDQVWSDGELAVASQQFVGQFHRWRLSRLLQLGARKSREIFLRHTSSALGMLIVTARNRFSSPFVSLTRSAAAVYRGLWTILDIVFGLPATTPGDVTHKIATERAKYLIAELDIMPNASESWTQYCQYVKEKCSLAPVEKYKTSELRPPPVPFVYQTPSGQIIDLRLFNKDVIQALTAILEVILESAMKGWFVQFKEELIAELRSQNVETDEISKQVTEAALNEYLERIFEAILDNEEIENLQPGIGQLLVSQARSVFIMQQAIVHIRQKMNETRDQLERDLRATYPVRSRVKAWVNEQLQAFETHFISEHMFSAHEEAIGRSRAAGLQQTTYFLQRDLNFLKEREPVLLKELQKVKIPQREYYFSTRIWFPSNYIVYKHHYGETERVLAMFSDEPYMVGSNSGFTAANQPTFSVRKYHVRNTTSQYPFWRWFNYFGRMWAWTWNTVFFLGIVVPWFSPLSLNALCSCKPFYVGYVLDRNRGLLRPNTTSLTQSLSSRLRLLWGHVRQSRKEFEEEPDTGFLGKTFTRQINRVWNYFFKGILGTLGLCVVFPPLCISVSLFAIIAAIATPLWMPILVLLVNMFYVIFYDFDHPNAGRRRIMLLLQAVFWQFLIQGLIQPIAALVTSIIFCPLVALFIMIAAILRYSFRGLWDTLMFYAVIKSRARVPASDSFVVRRISGPGLASQYFLQMTPELTLAAVESYLECHVLDVWSSKTKREIDKPIMLYKRFIGNCFGPFSGKVEYVGVFQELRYQCQELSDLMSAAVMKRKSVLNTHLRQEHAEIREKVKLQRKDLRVVLFRLSQLLKDFYPDKIFPKLDKTPAEFWEERQLGADNYVGLSCQLLKEIFNEDFMTPLEQADSSFQLEVQHLDLSRYVKMLASSDPRDDLSGVSEVHTPQAGVKVVAPSLDVNMFDPETEGIRYDGGQIKRQYWRYKPWKFTQTLGLSKLVIPPTIPHPTLIAIAVYNRVNDASPINELDDIFLRLMRAAQHMPYVSSIDVQTTSNHVDSEPSTPDGTADLEPLNSHLAQAERTFSDLTVHTSTPSIGCSADVSPHSVSQPDSLGLAFSHSMDCIPERAPLDSRTAHTLYDNVPLATTRGRDRASSSSLDSNPGVMMYVGREEDTSCVIYADGSELEDMGIEDDGCVLHIDE